VSTQEAGGKPLKLYIKTYGCQMNVYDSQRMADVLAGAGYRPCEAPEEADMVILNTCHIREKAAEKVYSELGRLKPLKDEKAAEGKRMIVAVAGCVAQAEGAEMVRRAPVVDLVFGPQTYHRLPAMVGSLMAGEGMTRLVDTDFPAEEKFDFLPQDSADRAPARFLTIQEGCDKFCTYCVVPYTRGAEFSRPVAAILAEAERMVKTGAREITLLGQNVNAFHGAGPDGTVWGLGRLARRLADIEGLAHIRYTTSHPKDVDDELIAAHKEVPALVPFLHLPVQSGSDRILAAMNRHHTADDYRRIVGRLKAARPDLALSSDFIVGFPGETDRDFEDTLKLVREIGFVSAFSFKYSPRPGTPAATAPDQIPEDVKAARLAALQTLLDRQQKSFNRTCIGREMTVLIEREGRHEGQLVGKSLYMQPVHFTGPAFREAQGRLATVRVTGAEGYSLYADFLAVETVLPHHQMTEVTTAMSGSSAKVEARV